MTPNQTAFLSMLAHSEGTDRCADPYRCCYGFKHLIGNLLFHPAEWHPDGTREWKGEPLDSLGTQYEHEVSTAAGRYQIRLKTWLAAKAALNLSSFDPQAQDDAALWLIKGRGALALVTAGRTHEAISLCKDEWASLPGGSSHQPERTFAYLLDFYRQAGGAFASDSRDA